MLEIKKKGINIPKLLEHFKTGIETSRPIRHNFFQHFFFLSILIQYSTQMYLKIYYGLNERTIYNAFIMFHAQH